MNCRAVAGGRQRQRSHRSSSGGGVLTPLGSDELLQRKGGSLFFQAIQRKLAPLSPRVASCRNLNFELRRGVPGPWPGFPGAAVRTNLNGIARSVSRCCQPEGTTQARTILACCSYATMSMTGGPGVAAGTSVVLLVLVKPVPEYLETASEPDYRSVSPGQRLYSGHGTLARTRSR
eukprot:873317-Rhodomonas_salina.2